MKIRRMVPGDIDRVMKIADSLPEAPHWPRSAYANIFIPGALPKRISLAAEDTNGNLVGFLMAVLIPPEAELETIAVVAPMQRQGIAMRLLSELLDVLRKERIKEVMLEVRESNRGARGFYGSAGFVETGRRAGYYSEPKEDAILLRRRVEKRSRRD